LRPFDLGGESCPARDEGACFERLAESRTTHRRGRALIPLTPTQHSARPHAAIRQPASFLAHLIATRQALPQTRERRRIEPGVAVAIYSAASAMREPAPDRYRSAFSRAM
jgi:hypothetical protein